MTKDELFKKYQIDESHNVWDTGIDSWMSIEIYRIMHGGKLPPPDDLSTKWILDFIDMSKKDMKRWVSEVMSRKDWGSLFLTAKRLICTLHEQILTEINETRG